MRTTPETILVERDECRLVQQEQLEKLLWDIEMPYSFALRVIDHAFKDIPNFCGADSSLAGDGVEVLAEQLLEVVKSREDGPWKDIPRQIYLDTMKCFSRFVREHRRSLGYYGFDRAAAIVYATAFQLIGVDTFGDSDLTTTIVGLTMIVLAVIAMPALLALIVPATSAVASGGGMATAGVMAASAIPAGSRQPTGSATPSTTGVGTAAAGAPVGGGASGSAMPGGSSRPGAPTGGGNPGAPAGPGGGGPAGSTGQPGPAGRPSGAGSPSGGVAAGGGASGAAAATGHVGAVLAAAQAAQGAASSSVSDQGGPSGSGS